MKRLILIYFGITTLLSAEQQILAPISTGDLVDKITILQVKEQKIQDPEKLRNITYELSLLQKTLQESVPVNSQLEQLMHELFQTNQTLWNTEDAIRAKEAKKEFDKEFIEIARSVYMHNRERHRIKRVINEKTGSPIMEEKQYTGAFFTDLT